MGKNAAAMSHPALSPQGLAPAARRFHLINVSPQKTGTRSIAGIFRRFRAAHEYQHDRATAAIHDRHFGHTDSESLKVFVLARDAAGLLEVDSASFNHWYADILTLLFPRARFLLSVREPQSWLESLLSHAQREVICAAKQGQPFPPRFQRQADMIFDEFDTAWFRDDDALQRRLPHLCDTLLGFWVDTHRRLIALLPEDRRLILSTGRLSQSLSQLADFVGVSENTLDSASAHLHRRPDGLSILSVTRYRPMETAAGRTAATLWRELDLEAGPAGER